MTDTNSKYDRRTILRSSGVLSTSFVGSMGIAGVAEGRKASKTPYVGVAYDPVSKEITGDASGRIVRAAGQLRGTIEIDGTTVPLALDAPANVEPLSEHSEPVPDDAVLSQFSERKRGEFELAGRPLHLHISSVENGDVSGLARYPGFEGKTAFVIREKRPNQTTDETVDDVVDTLIGGEAHV